MKNQNTWLLYRGVKIYTKTVKTRKHCPISVSIKNKYTSDYINALGLLHNINAVCGSVECDLQAESNISVNICHRLFLINVISIFRNGQH